ncbi:MAG: AAA family ATPase, partial [Actinomycetota bacterium]
LERLNDEFEQGWNTRIQARIGVNTGEVVAADPSSGQSFVSGDAVNVAARLEQTADPGEILLGESTYRLVRAAAIAEPVEPLALKGKSEPVPAYRLVVVEAGAEILPRRFDSPLVGREDELVAIRDAIGEAETSSSCRVVTVIGHAGVGKSRLTHEVVTTLGERAGVLRGRCLPYGEGITFWPVAEALTAAAGLDEAEGPDEARTRIASLLRENEEPMVAERLAAILGVGGAPGAIQESFLAIRRAFEAMASERPLVVVFDDIQWGEQTFLDLIQYLASFATGRPMLLLCLARPELLETRPDWGDVARIIRLESLGPEDSGRLVTNLLGEWSGPEEIGRKIVDGAGGNPLFIEEMLRMLVDEGALAREDGRWVAHGDISNVGAPDTVQAVISARLDRLDPAERDVLQRAAVVGEVFWWGAVADLADDTDATEVGRRLQALVRRELIRPDPTTFAGEDAFRFGHLLIRDVAYESLSKKVRAGLHARFADWVGRRAGERAAEYDEIVGYHAERAYRYLAELGPMDERGTGLAALAADHLASAGLRSFDRGDMPAAANLLARAAALLPSEDPRRLALLPRLAEALEETGRWSEADAILGDAIGVARAAGDRRVELLSEIRRLRLRAFVQPETRQADVLAQLRELVTVLEESGDDAGVAAALKLMGEIAFWGGHCTEAVGLFERAIGHARRAGDRRLELAITSGAVLALDQGPTPVDAAIERIEAFLRHHEDDRIFRCRTRRSLAALAAMQGRFDDAWSILAEGKDLARELGLTVELAAGLERTGGEIAVMTDDFRAAERELRRAVETLRRVGDKGHLGSVGPDLARVVLEDTGREEEAIELAHLGIDWMIDDVDAQVRAHAAKARAVARLGETEEAERLARYAVSRAMATDYVSLRTLSHEALAEVLEATGRTEEAADAVRRAATEYEAKGAVVLAARMRRKLEALGEAAATRNA